jgi:hypothetical protein
MELDFALAVSGFIFFISSSEHFSMLIDWPFGKAENLKSDIFGFKRTDFTLWLLFPYK